MLGDLYKWKMSMRVNCFFKNELYAGEFEII